MSNLSMTINVEAPALVAALSSLAAAIAVDPGILTPDTPRPQMPAPVTGPAPVMPQTPGPAAPAAPAPVTPPPAPAAPVTPPAPAPAPAMPVAGAPTYTLDQISKAGAALVDAGKMEPLLGLLTIATIKNKAKS